MTSKIKNKTMNKPALKIDNLTQQYGKHRVLDNISFMVEAGEYVGLVGVNGAGKTTLIKSILDFIAVKSGNIELFGLPHHETASRTCLSFLPEKFLPPYYLTGKDFLFYMAELNQVELDEAEIARIFSLLDLDAAALKKSVRQYSKGMAQKLGLASCFLSQRKMLLFDEPMSGLDPKARAYLKNYLLELKQQDLTLFFSTHLLVDVESVCDRIIILHEGHVRFNGTPEQCCNEFAMDSLEQAYLKCIEADVSIQPS